MPAGRLVRIGPPVPRTRNKSRRTPTLNKKLKQIVKRGKEKKHFTIPISTTVSDAGTIWQLSGIAQGTTLTQRIGNSIDPYRMIMRVILTLGDSTNITRLILFRFSADRIPVIADLLDTTNIASPNQNYVPEYYERKQATVIWDKTFSMVDEANSAQHVFTKNIKLNFKTQFTGNLGTSYGANQLYLLGISNSGVVPNPGVIFETTLLYTDS